MGIHQKDGADLRGLIIPDSRIDYLTAYSAADSVLTEASPHAGVPEPLADSDMSLETSGSQSAAKDLRIKTHIPGHVDDEAARFIWQQTTGTDTNEKGWNPPFTGARGVEIVDNGAGVTTGVAMGRTDIITLSDGSMCAAASSDIAVLVWYKRAEDSNWSQVATPTPGDLLLGESTPINGWNTESETQNWIQGPAFCELPSGRVLLFFWANEAGRNIRCLKSDDRGVSWALHSESCLREFLTQSTAANAPESLGAGPLKAAYKDGQILLIASVIHQSNDGGSAGGVYWTGSNRTAGNVWLQMASSDLGATFDRVETGTGATGQNGTGFDITTVNGEFVVAYIRNALLDTAGGPADYPISDIAVVKLGSAYQRISNATVSSFKNAHRAYARIGDDDGQIPLTNVWPGHDSDPRFYNWELALTSSPEGDLYLGVVAFGFEVPGQTGGDEKQWNIARLFTSADAGATWADPGRTWYAAGAAGTEPALSTWPGYASLPDTATRGGEFFNWSGSYPIGSSRSFTRLRHISFSWNRGQLICLSSAMTTQADVQDGTAEQASKKLFTLHMGGYSDLTRGHNLHPVDDGDRGNLRHHYIPFQKPMPLAVGVGEHFWQAVTAGVQSETIVWDAPSVNRLGRLQLITGDGAGNVGDAHYNAYTNEALAASEATASDSHSHVVDADFALKVYHADTPAPGFACSVRIVCGVLTGVGGGTPTRAQFNIGFDQNQIVLYDFYGAATLVTKQLSELGLSYPVHIRARVGGYVTGAFAGYDWYVWASAYDPSTTVKKWVLVGSSAGATNRLTADATGAAPEIRWGHFPGGSATINKSDWYFMQCGSSNLSSEAGAPEFPASGWQQTGDPDELDDYSVAARRISSVPVYVDDGVRLAGKDGPAVRGNEWQIKTRYDYGVENIHHEINASPDAVWRSTSDAAQVEIAWKVGPSSAAGGFSLNRVYGLYLGNINFKTAFLDVQADGSTSWTQVAEIDAADGMTGLAFDRKGNTIRPNAASIAAGQYFPYNLLAGSHVALNTGGATTYHPIETNSEGSFTGVATKRTTIRIGGDFAAASAGGPTVLCDIWSKEAVAVFHQMDTAHKIRLRIPAQTTAEGYFQIGAFIAGSVALFGRQHSRGHMREIQTNTDLTTQRSGVRRASVHGKARRAVELSWDDSVDLSEMQNAAPAPDFVSTMYGAIAGDPAPQHGVFNDGPTLVKGVLEATDGSSVPVVYLSRIPATDYDAGVVTSKFADRSEFLMGRIVSTKYRVENVLGDDSLNEVVTGTTIRIDEEL